VSNISIDPETPNVPTSEVLEISVVADTLTITCQPLTEFAAYFITFKSTLSNPFVSLNADAKVFEDGVSNKYLIIGPMDSDNPVKNFLTNFVRDNIYTDDESAVVNKYIKALSVVLSKSLYDVRQVGNENYLSFDVTDERKVRGSGPFDRLDQESAYQLSRVGYNAATSKVSKTFNIANFPSYPITLQKTIGFDSLIYGIDNTVGNFNVHDLVLNLTLSPVTKITSVVFSFSTLDTYVYDITKLGYQILDSKYDQDYASTYLQLESNQIKLNDRILSDPDFSISNIVSVAVNYEYKDLGLVIDPNSVNLYTVKSAFREVIPPIVNIFNLEFAPIVDSTNTVYVLGGVIFSDPNTNTGAAHPAFINEIPFRLNALPSLPGQYSIDYVSGTVYVYGNDANNDGTGPTPPLASYSYRYVFKTELDYVYDESNADLVALPLGSLVTLSGSVNFNYEKVLVPNVDYVADLHKESLNERIENKLFALNILKTQSSPITNVFRVYNETSGEIYTIDRWSDNKVYFRYNNPPRIDARVGERVNFSPISGEKLFVNQVTTNNLSVRIFKILLNHNNIIAGTEDGIGTSFNSSVSLSDATVFVNEKWFNEGEDISVNLDNLVNVGEYQIDYTNGVIYCAVDNDQPFSVGFVNYKFNQIIPGHSHLISVDDIYYRNNTIQPKNKQFNYISFGEGSILVDELNTVSESTLNNVDTAVYQVLNNKVGAFNGLDFIAKVTNQVKFVRSVFDYNDLVHNYKPINFGLNATNTSYTITTAPVTGQLISSVSTQGPDLIVKVNDLPYISPGITYTFTVTRISDGYDLWNGGVGGTLTAGEPAYLTLSGYNTPVAGQAVNVTFTYTINDLSRVVVDYNRGDMYTDYTYLADEILVSYEYGDNNIDFRLNRNLPEGTEYYVSYKVGALRDALLKNFGTLVNIPELTDFDISLDRERYREALTAALTSFIQGPTVTAMKNIGKTISHIEPAITEAAFQNWSLGSSLLVPQEISTTGEFELLPTKYGNGVYIHHPDQTIKFPVNSNIRFEEGTFETWVLPQWNGLDNNAELTFSILRNGVPVLSDFVFLGGGEYHPDIVKGLFSVSNQNHTQGIPNKNKDGVYIYYANDPSNTYQRWYFEIVDGYVSSPSASYKVKISTHGNFYDVKNLLATPPTNTSIFTGVSNVNLSVTGGAAFSVGWTFIADLEHFLLDFGKDVNKSRVSIYKDSSGYLNFRVYDDAKTSYTISSNIANWKVNELHHVAASWKLNNYHNRDEIHLFVDGFEVPNIIKYGQKLQPVGKELLRAINVEEIIGSADKTIVSGSNMTIVGGSASVTVNYDLFGLGVTGPSDTLFIDEIGFNPNGYTVISVSSNVATLSAPMPYSLNNARYSFNRMSFVVNSDIDVAPNSAISTIQPVINSNDLLGTSGGNTVYSSSADFEALGVVPGQLLEILLMTPVLYTIVSVSGHTLVVNGTLPSTFSGISFNVYGTTETELSGPRSSAPEYTISKNSNFDNILTLNGFYPYYIPAGSVILIRTLGLNHRKVKKPYYLWSDGYENIIQTRLPAPISLDEVKVTKIILPPIAISTANSMVMSNTYVSNNIPATNPTNSITGRTLTVTLSGTNADFSTPIYVTIYGSPNNEVVSFTDYGSLDTVNEFTAVTSITVVAKAINGNRSPVVVSVKEKYSATHQEFNGAYPVIKFSYNMDSGYNLHSDGYDYVTDDAASFSDLYINNYLIINSGPAAGSYKIVGVSTDRKSVYLDTTSPLYNLPLPSFTNAAYQILNVTKYRTGLQNGFFVFEKKNFPGVPYLLPRGTYEFEYETYTKIKIEPLNSFVYLGSDFHGRNQFNGSIDQVKIYSTMLTDTRVRESVPANQSSITKDFNSLKELKKDPNTLMLIDFNNFPFTNSADYYSNTAAIEKHFLSSVVVNENFGTSLVFLDKPLVLSNDGILDTRKEATIEFWVNPIFDTANDPNNRFYFDAYGAVIEETMSTTYNSIKLAQTASQIISVKLKGGDPSIDYFAGGKLEIDTQHAFIEQGTNFASLGYVTASKPILQVISVKIIGDLKEEDYFQNGSVGTDSLTIYLGRQLPSLNLPLSITYQTTENGNSTLNTQVVRLNKKLPYKNSSIIVTYLPAGVQGDRVAIYKDNVGYINFGISASGTDYVVRAPTYWEKNTWHRVKASYTINSNDGTDEMRLFLDGYEYGNLSFGQDLIFGAYPIVAGNVTIGDGYHLIGDIRFKDSINNLFIGSDFTGKSPVFSIIDNLRISNLSRPVYAPFGEAIDVNYNNNLDAVFPVTSDLFTTYLLNFNSLVTLNDDFAILKNRETGLFDFSINIFDSFGIVNSSSKVQEILEKLIKVLKPANSRVFIEYTR
jgi:hypothetical protein